MVSLNRTRDRRDRAPTRERLWPTSLRLYRTAVQAVKVDTAKLDYMVDMVGEMVIAQSLVRHDPDLANTMNRAWRAICRNWRASPEVQKTAMSMRMVPIGQLFQKMARLVRDLSRKSGKQVELETGGEDTELDRNIVEELADPLMHMVRNAVDHGIEPARRARGGGQSRGGPVTAQGRTSGRSHPDRNCGRRPRTGPREDPRARRAERAWLRRTRS